MTLAEEIRREAEFQHLAAFSWIVWGKKIHLLHRFSPVDCLMLELLPDSERIWGCAEIRGRNIKASTAADFGGLLLPKKKYQPLVVLSATLQIRSFFVWTFTDGSLFYADVAGIEVHNYPTKFLPNENGYEPDAAWQIPIKHSAITRIAPITEMVKEWRSKFPYDSAKNQTSRLTVDQVRAEAQDQLRAFFASSQTANLVEDNVRAEFARMRDLVIMEIQAMYPDLGKYRVTDFLDDLLDGHDAD